MRLQGKAAIVTGAGSGFGEGIAKRFAQEGAKVVVNDINIQGGERVAAEIGAAGGTALFVRADVSRDADVAALIRARSRNSARSTSSSTTPATLTATARCWR